MIILKYGKLENPWTDISWVLDWTQLEWFLEDITVHDHSGKAFLSFLGGCYVWNHTERGPQIAKLFLCNLANNSTNWGILAVNCQQEQPKCSSKFAECIATYVYWGEHQESEKRAGFLLLLYFSCSILHCVREPPESIWAMFRIDFCLGSGAARLFAARASNLGHSLWWLHHVGWVAWLGLQRYHQMAVTMGINLHTLE